MRLVEMRTDVFVAFLVVYYFKCIVEKNKAYSCPWVAWILLSLNVEITEKMLLVISVYAVKMSLSVYVDVILPVTPKVKAPILCCIR